MWIAARKWACRAAVGPGMPSWRTSITTALFEALQAVGFVKGQVDRWPELQELAMGNDELLPDPRSWPRFQPGDDLCGNLHNPFFVQSAGGRYYDVAVEMGLGESHVSRGIAIADVDGDGRLDYAVANQWEPSIFYHNLSPHPGEFMGLRLRLAPDRPAIGATGDGVPAGREAHDRAGGWRQRPFRQTQPGYPFWPGQRARAVAAAGSDTLARRGWDSRAERTIASRLAHGASHRGARKIGGRSAKPAGNRLRPRLAAPQVEFSAAGGQS